MRNVIQVYEFDCGLDVVPPTVVSEAERLNDGKRLTDRRTRGSKHIEAWAEKQSEQYMDALRSVSPNPS